MKILLDFLTVPIYTEFRTNERQAVVMKTATVKLKEIKDVYDFVATVTGYTGEIDIVSGRYRVNAKSVMGIFALDLTQPLNLEIFGDDAKAEEVMQKLEKFCA